jgi:hypothetical protein
MRRKLTIGTMRSCRSIVVALVLGAFCGSSWAVCVEGAEAPATQQMACCKAGHDRCPMKDSASNCCLKSGARLQLQATIVKASPMETPVRIPLARMVAPVFSTAYQVYSRASSDSSPPSSQLRPPAYILFSILLI